MTVRENLAFGLEMRRVARADRDRLVNEAAQVLGLADLLERTPRQLSGGQRQRVAVGRAIVRKPAVFLFDEPLSNLDAKLRLQTRSEIGRLQRELGTTTIYVTHDQVEAMTLGHRIALLDAGRLQQCGPPLELYERPANRFVAGFLGSPAMNFFPAVAGADGALVGPGYRFVLPAAARASTRVEPGAAVTVGIRPEHLARARDPAAPGAAFVEGEVDLVEPLGSTVVVYLRVGDLRVATLAAGAGLPAVGERLRLVPAPEKLHLFGVRS
jgi:multiple sugar transport system ATP-binding protein